MAIVLAVMLAACWGGTKEVANRPATAAEVADAGPALAALQASRFDEAKRLATEVLARDPHNARAAGVRALVTYQAAGNALIIELGAVMAEAEGMKFFDHEAGRAAWKQFSAQLEAVDHDLAIAGADPSFSMELCIACWEHDWNRNGEVDERDRRLMEIEVDGEGKDLPDHDPRRRPTFRFDVGDVDWARAMVAFQRAGAELALAYKWSELDKLWGSKPDRVRIPLIDAGRVKKARQLILDGVGFADRCRAEYLAETDDDREWVPNPRQNSHPVPMPMTEDIYATWAGVTGDVRRMLTSEEGISIKQAAALIDRKLSLIVPDAYIDVGAMLRDPKDIVLDLTSDAETTNNAETILRGLLGNGYRASMPSSPLVERLRHMKGDLDRGSDTMEHKLRYLMWLN